MIIVDLKDTVVGRAATQIVKSAILGEQVVVLNCKEAVITGTRAEIFAKYKQKRDRGTPAKGPFIPRQSHSFVKRIIRGMIPYKKSMGSDAFKRVQCYAGVPEEFQGKQMTTYKDASVTKLRVRKYTTVRDVTTFLGGKI